MADVDANICILLIDDHADTLTLQAMLLRRRGYEVHTAGSVEAARTVAGAQRLDLVISDIRLPDGSGLVLLEELRQRFKLPTIAITGLAEQDAGPEAAAAGIDRVLVKPIAPDQLIEAVERLLGEADGGAGGGASGAG
ncbi:MAG: response regulator [Phycisphaeraceae bacterium]